MKQTQFVELIEQALRKAGSTDIVLGNVRFFIDSEGPWQECVSYDLPTIEWDVERISEDLTKALTA
jgi:hypothetical protein